jgi:acetyl-CoA acetyltransferase family protein
LRKSFKVFMKKERIAVINGIRTPMGKAGGVLRSLQADELGAITVKELLAKLPFEEKLIDELIIGNVAQPAHAANIAKVIAIYAGLPKSVPAFTVHRNCASGMQAVSSAAVQIRAGEGKIYIAGGVESMSNIPLLFNAKMTGLFEKLMKARSLKEKLSAIATFRLSFLAPIVGVVQGLTDPTCNLIMGLTAENIAKDFAISRKEQDDFSAASHQKAEKATKDGIFAQEMVAICGDKTKGTMISADEGIRDGQTSEKLSKMKPYFEKPHGTVTVGNSSQLTDGACMLALTSESYAKEMGLEVLGYIKDYAYSGCDNTRMGLGPVFATSKLFKQTGMSMKDIGLIELNEAFAAQVLGCMKAFESSDFCSKNLDSNALGSIDTSILNVNGGAIALGHPVGMTGARIILHSLKEMKRRNVSTGLASLCIGGGQGASFILEL